jgi:hypothetical protein
MYCLSSLGRKVLDQTTIPQNDPEWLWWVERRLQSFRINALVQMIQNSKEMDREYIDGYVSRYRWGLRSEEERIFIAEHEWLFYMVQQVRCDFPWNLWTDFVRINNPEMVHRSINVMLNNTAIRSHSYWLGIYKSEQEHQNAVNKEISVAVTKSQVNFSVQNDRTITDQSIEKWNKLKGVL